MGGEETLKIYNIIINPSPNHEKLIVIPQSKLFQ